MDQLVGLSDDLGKLDGYVESITRKVATYLGEVLEDQRDKLHENLLANNSKYKPFFSFWITHVFFCSYKNDLPIYTQYTLYALLELWFSCVHTNPLVDFDYNCFV